MAKTDANDVVMGGGSLVPRGQPIEVVGGEVRPAEPTRILTAEETARSALDYLTDASRLRTPQTGYTILDNAIGGLPPGAMFTVGGRTGAGKSSLLLGMSFNQAGRGARVGIVSCEDPEWVWGTRILSHLSDVNSAEFFRRANGTPDMYLVDQAKIGIERAKSYGVHFAYATGKPIKSVIEAIRELIQARGCSVIMVDYLQAIVAKGQDRYVARTDTAQALKGYCQQHGVPLVLASQLKRPENGNPFREPHNGDLKDSGDIENMSEVIVLLWQTSDVEDATVLGKVGKIKWSPKRPRFQIERDVRTGALYDLVKPTEAEATATPSSPPRPRSNPLGLPEVT